MSRNEATTRQDLIDQALTKAGWNLKDGTQVGQEIPVDGFDPQAWAALQAQLKKLHATHQIPDTLPSGISDYVLYRENGEILAIVEAKKTSVDPRIAEPQARFYVQEIEKRQGYKPFVFLSNGYRIYFMDEGLTHKREVNGFFSRDDLENLLYIRNEGYPLSMTDINVNIADRLYQHEAIRRVAEAFENGKRRALVVMATGTGKTRTAMALTDVFMRANQARKILFVADRDALVEQAIDEGFHDHLPSEPCTRITSNNIDTSNRLYAVTLQTLNNVLEAFTPGFFDLIIFDEVHRSIFNQYKKVLEYFDARLIGLTATPANFIDRNTFLTFECQDAPTYLYSYQQAIDEGYLVDYELYNAKTRFQREGIKGATLSEEEKNELLEGGIDPDSLDYEGSELEKTVSNRDTLRRQWEEIMDTAKRDQSGQLIGKTIIFALSQDHALRLQSVFEEMYPQYVGLSEVITYKTNYKGASIKNFKKKTSPRIAISVDMLDTGVNVPEVVNLVVMKPVQSRIKLEQMIGRGTRNDAACENKSWLPRSKKEDFLIIDFWENDFSKKSEAAPAADLPILVKLWNTHVKQFYQVLGSQQNPEALCTKSKLRELVNQLPKESFSVRKYMADIEDIFTDDFWTLLNHRKLEFLEKQVGPLLRHAPAEDVAALTFAHKIERLKLSKMTDSVEDRQIVSVVEDVGRLPLFVRDDALSAAAMDFCLHGSLPTATLSELDDVSDLLARHMRHRRDQVSVLVELDLKDTLAYRSYIVLDEQEQPVYAQQYRETVEKQVRDLVNQDAALQKLNLGEKPSDEELLDLERKLRDTLGNSYLQLDERTIHRAYGYRVGSLLEFVQRVLELPDLPDYEDILEKQFREFTGQHTFNSNQIKFIAAIRNTLKQKKHLHKADLYEAPFTTFGANAVERIFSDDELSTVLSLAQKLSLQPAP
jgi:type I restriction enzyme, R subunit